VDDMLRKLFLSFAAITFAICADIIPLQADASTLIQPDDLVYVGAFRLPDSPGMPENVNWEWSNWAGAATSFPNGDPNGPNDGFPGSLFGVGHDQTQYISEISIPVPVNAAGKNVEELNTAGILQGFKDIKKTSGSVLNI
jgi:hypothetical protein